MSLPFPSDRFFSQDRAKQLVLEWKRKGERIVFTNGCFDLLHPGHIDLLKKASGLGERLVVGLNSDRSIKRLNKGEERPIKDEASRAVILAALEMVDLVTIFEEDTPQGLIELLDPDFLAKGGDYKEEEVVGKRTVEEKGGRVVLLPLLEGYSSTALIDRISKGKGSSSDG